MSVLSGLAYSIETGKVRIGAFIIVDNAEKCRSNDRLPSSKYVVYATARVCRELCGKIADRKKKNV